jgi:hypothetical protein
MEAASGFDAAFFAITCGGMLVATIILAVGVYYVMMRLARGRQSLMDRGIPTVGRIIDVQQTGLMVNYSPGVAIRLLVTPPEGTPYTAPYDEPYEATIQAVIDVTDVVKYQPGTVIPILMHPDDPTTFALETRSPEEIAWRRQQT